MTLARSTSSAALLAALLAAVLPSRATAAPAEIPIAEAGPTMNRGVVWFDGGADLRLRTDVFGGLALDGAAGIPTTDGVVWSSNLRLRLAPTLHITRAFRIQLLADLLGNLVLGASPSFTTGGPGAASSLPFDSAGSPRDQRNAVEVPLLFGEWEPLARVWLRLGRMPGDFGMGLSEHARPCDDCDALSVYDGLELRSDAFGVGVVIGWRFVSTGPIGYRFDDGRSGRTGGAAAYVAGQPVDLSGKDDTDEWLFEVVPNLASAAEAERRVAEARASGGWLFDWAARARLRQGRLSGDRFEEGRGAVSPSVDTPYDEVPQVPRDISMWYPGLSLRARGWPAPQHHLDVEGEFQAAVGEVGTTEPFPEDVELGRPSTRRDVLAFGAALRARYEGPWLLAGLLAVYASGDPEGQRLGVRDGSNTASLASEDFLEEGERYSGNTTWEQFVAHRSFLVDRILFREVVGAVTNTWLVRPSIGAHGRFGPMGAAAEVSALIAWAAASEATPGQRGFYGTELGVDLRGEFGPHVRLGLGSSLLLPGEALADGADAAAPGAAWTTQLDLFLSY